MQRLVRPRPLQACVGPGERDQEDRRQHRQGLRQDDEVCRQPVQMQDAEAGGLGPNVHYREEAHRFALLPRRGEAAPRALAVNQPSDADVDSHRLPQRGEVLLHEHCDKRQCGRAAVRLHDQVSVRRASGLQLRPVADHRHAGYPRPSVGGQEHHRDDGDHSAGAPPRGGALLRRHLRDVWLPSGHTGSLVPLDQAALPQPAPPHPPQQDGPAEAVRTFTGGEAAPRVHEGG